MTGHCKLRTQNITPLSPDLPVVFPSPTIWQFLYYARLGGGHQQAQSVLDDNSLLVNVARLSQGLPKGESYIRYSRGRQRIRHLLVHHGYNGGNSFCFDGPCHQPNGPVADGSGGSQEHDVHSRVFKTPRSVRRCLCHECHGIVYETHAKSSWSRPVRRLRLLLPGL